MRRWSAAVGVALVGLATPVAVAPAPSQSAPSASISGHVSTAGPATAGGSLVLWQDGEGDSWTRVSTIQVPPAGAPYEFTSLPADTYRLCVTTEDVDHVGECFENRYPPEPSYGATDLELAEGQQMTGVDLELSRGGKIAGTVTRTDGVTSVPIAEVPVTAHMLVVRPPSSGSYWAPVASARSTSDGTYTVGSLPSGVFRVCFSGPATGPTLAYECFDERDDALNATDVTVQAPRTTHDVDAELGVQATIAVRVVGSNGGPLSAGLRLHHLVDGAWTPFPRYILGTRTSTGTAYINLLRPGTYRLQAWTTRGSDVFAEWWNDKTSFDLADDIVLTYGDSASIDFELPLDGFVYPPATSSPTPEPAPAPAPTPAPSATALQPTTVTISFDRRARVRGRREVGSRIKVTGYRATVTGGTPAYTFQWYANGRKLRGAVRPSLRLPRRAEGTRVTVRVTVTVGTTARTLKVRAGRIR